MGNLTSTIRREKTQTLTQTDLEFLQANTKFDATTINNWHAGFYQDCPNGKLSREKFVEVYNLFFPCGSGDTHAFCDHVFRTFDQDNSGYIDFKEFLLAVNMTSAGTSEEKLKWAFRVYDIDGNGHIDLPEMTKIIIAIREMLVVSTPTTGIHEGQPISSPATEDGDQPDQVARNIMQKMDTNYDGILDENEFIQGCITHKSLMKTALPGNRVALSKD